MNRIKKRVLFEVKHHFESYKYIFKKKDSILDIGIGPGFTAKFIQLNLPSIKLVGLDVINILQENVQLVIYDGKKIPFDNKFFDVSIIFYSLHHAKSPFKLLKEAIRITKRNIIIIEEFCLSSANANVEMQKERETLIALGIPPDLYHNDLNQEELEDLFRKYKLTVRYRKKLKTKSNKSIKKYLYILEL